MEGMNTIDDFHITLTDSVEATQSTPSPNTTPPCNVDENAKEIEIVPNGGEKKRKQTSVVWNHFSKRKCDGLWKAVCNYCDKKLGGESKNGTRHLHDHFKRCPLRTQRHITQSMKKLAQTIIRYEYSLSIVDHEGFVEYSNTLQPMFKVVSRNTIRSNILKMYKAEKVKAIKLIEDNKSRIAITTDMWTASNQKKGYMVVTAHYIDDSWILQSKILRFMYVPCPHNAKTISDALMGCLMDWNVDRKLSTLTVDNCTTNDAATPIMKDKLFSSGLMLSGDFFHMRCAAHILNLIVKDGMSILDKGIVNICESVSYWTATTKRNEKFMETVLALDMPVRWNSTYVMLSTALIYKSVFARLKQRELGYKTLPLEDDWVKARDLCDKLFLFYQVTEMFSGSKYPTANLLFPKVCEIRMAITDWLSSSNENVRAMASNMEEKFLKYWDVTHGIMAVASILDPRYKMKLIEYFFS
ncbi:hypothetical protein UlMin_036930 [Ulmus minor]